MGWSRREVTTFGAIVALGAALRWIYLLRLELPIYDPWRHLLLIRNLAEGRGFTLFEGQPYIWYQPLWYRLCAALPLEPDGLAGLFSWLSVPVFYLVLRGENRKQSGAAVGGLLMAAFGPLILFTCHYGSEALALFLILVAALVAVRTTAAAPAFIAGLLAGLALAARLNLVFGLFLFLPRVRGRPRALALAGGIALPLLAAWWRNRQAINRYPYLFTWDGLAAESAGFGPISTLLVPWHPAVSAGLRRLHERIVPVPEWIRDAGGLRWDLMGFMLIAVVCLAVCRRRSILIGGVAGLVCFLLLDRSLSSNFFRVYLGIFPLLFAAIAAAIARLSRAPGRRGRWAAAGLVILILAAGARGLNPPAHHTLEEVTPPPDLLSGDAYMVTSGFYHPESLIYRFPERRFIGLPLHPQRLPDFLDHYPGFSIVIRHDFSVQNGWGPALRQAGFVSGRSVLNPYGRRYELFERP